MSQDAFSSALPLLPLRVGVVLPGRIHTIPVGRERSRTLVRDLRKGAFLALGVQKDRSVISPSLDDLHPIGVLARVKDTTDRGRRGIYLVVEAIHRLRVNTLDDSGAYWRCEAEGVFEVDADHSEAVATAQSLREFIREFSGDRGLNESLASAEDPGLLADRITAWLDPDDTAKTEVLLELDVKTRLKRVSELLTEARTKAELKERVDSAVRKDLTLAQKQQLLRHQLRAIKRELGEDDETESDDLRARLEKADLPEEVRKMADRELKRLEALSDQQPEAHVIRTYLTLIAELPWNTRAEVDHGIREVEAALNEDHFGLDDVKQRILEHMAVLKLSKTARGTILCLAGPPGVGKTSLAHSVARATGRPLQRVSLGGVRDEAEIRGHRRTYIGAMPGRLVNAIRKAGVKNPVIVLDEIDKLAKGWSGDPEAALLEVLDPEQNHTFTDHYLEVPFDLSEVLFIATANDLSTVSAPLRDRLEIIEVSGYTVDEKLEIAREHLVPKALEQTGLSRKALQFDDDTLADLIQHYTREAGVRQLQRQLAKLARTYALEFAKEQDEQKSESDANRPKKARRRRVNQARVRKALGRPKFLRDEAEKESPPGVAAGLAWTPSGGDLLYVETTRMRGKGRLELTGQLGDVMQESARAALAYLRTHADEWGIDADFLDSSDLHIHFPAGAVPKDGPSAGVTVLTALASLLTGRRVRPDTAMTGEATLRGRVLPVGGIKSKVLAAHRAGMQQVIIPKQNEADLEEVPETVREELSFVLASDMRDVLDAALMPTLTTTAANDPSAVTGSLPAA